MKIFLSTIIYHFFERKKYTIKMPDILKKTDDQKHTFLSFCFVIIYVKMTRVCGVQKKRKKKQLNSLTSFFFKHFSLSVKVESLGQNTGFH